MWAVRAKEGAVTEHQREKKVQEEHLDQSLLQEVRQQHQEEAVNMRQPVKGAGTNELLGQDNFQSTRL